MEDGNKRSRTSILKPQRSRNPLSEVEISELQGECTSAARATKRVNFKRISLVKPFILDSDEKTTIWDSTYEEEVPHTDSSHSPGKSSDSTSPENPGDQDDLNMTKFISDEAELDIHEIATEEIHKNRTVFLNETVEFTQAALTYNANRTNRTVLMDVSMNLTTLPLIDKENIAVTEDSKNKPSILSFAKRSKSIDRVNRSNTSINPNVPIDSDSGMEFTTNILGTIISSEGVNKFNNSNRDGLNVPRSTFHKVSNEFVPEAMEISYLESAQTASTKSITGNILNNIPHLRKEMFDLSRLDISGKENTNLAEFPASDEDVRCTVVDNASNRNDLSINTNKTVCFNESDDGMEFTKNIPATSLTPFNDAKKTNNTICFDESDDGMEFTKNIPVTLLKSVFVNKMNKNDDKNTNKTLHFNELDDGSIEFTENIPATMPKSVFANEMNKNDDKNTNKTLRFDELDDGMEFTKNIPTMMVVSEYGNKFNRSRIIRDWNSSRNMPLKTFEDMEISGNYASSTSLKEAAVSSNNNVSIHFKQTAPDNAENTQTSASKNVDDETRDNTTVLNDISMDLTTLTSTDKETIEQGIENTSIILEGAKEMKMNEKNRDDIDVNSEINLNESNSSMELTTNIPAMIAAPANSYEPDNTKKKCDSKMSENVPFNVSDKTASDDMDISYCGVPQMPSEQNIENIACLVQNNDLTKMSCLKGNCEDIVVSNALNRENVEKSCSSKENMELSCSSEKTSAVLPVTQLSLEEKVDTKQSVPNEQRLLHQDSNTKKEHKENNTCCQEASIFNMLNACDIDSIEDTSFFLGFDDLQKNPERVLNMDTTKVNISSNPLFHSFKSMSPCVDSTQQLINYTLGTQNIEIPRISEVLEPKMPQYDDTRSESLCESVMLANTSNKRNESDPELLCVNIFQESPSFILENTELELSHLNKSDILEDSHNIRELKSHTPVDYKSAMDRLKHVMDNVKLEKVEFTDVKLTDKRLKIDFESSYNFIKQKLESLSLKLKPPDRPTLQEYYETLKAELSEPSLESEEDKENEEYNADMNIEIPPKVPSLLEKIRETEHRCAPYWKFDGKEDDKYHFSTLYGKLKLVLQFNSEGVVWDIRMIDNLSDDSPPISQYVMRLFKEALDNRQLEATLGFRYTILSFLDYLYMVMQNMLDFMCELDKLKMKMDPTNIITFRILDLNLILNWVVTVDITDLKNIRPDNVSVEIRTFSSQKPTVSHEDAIKNLVNGCPKGLSFLKCFRKKIDEYIQSSAKRRKFSERK